jgi:hypothetical protein
VERLEEVLASAEVHVSYYPPPTAEELKYNNKLF